MWYMVWPYPYVASAVATFLLLIVTLCAVFVVHRKRQHAYFRKQSIPGPAPSSILFGNVTETLALGASETVHRWTTQYGKTFGYFEGPVPVLVTSDLYLLQQLLVKQFHLFHGRKLYPMQPSPDDQADHENRFLVLMDGQVWKRLRSIVNPTFSTLKMKQITPLMNSCIDVLMEVLDEKCQDGDTVDIYNCYSKLTLDVIATCAFGLNIDCQRKDSEFKSKCKEVFDAFGAFDLLDILCLVFAEWRKFWRLFGFCRTLNRPHPFDWIKARAAEIIELRIKNPSYQRMDLMQIMLNTSVMDTRERKLSSSDGYAYTADNKRKNSLTENASSSQTRSNGARRISVSAIGESFRVTLTNGLNKLRRHSLHDGGATDGSLSGFGGLEMNEKFGSSENHQPLTIKEMCANIALFLLVGSDTTSALLGYISYELALNQDVQEKLYDEITQDLAVKEELSYEDVYKLPYLDMVVKETLRIHTIVSNDITCRRCCVETCDVSGIKFVRDMVVKPDVISIHFDPEQWGPVDVHHFCPDRHLPELSARRHPLAFIPFGAGPRHCIGMRFALLQAKLAITRTLRKFRLCKADNTQPLQKREDATITPRNGVNVILETR